MIEKKCEYCGKVMQLMPGQRDRKFCSQECYSEYRKLPINTDFDWKKLRDGLYECRYHPGGQIGCTNRQCDKCGWNPEVAEARTEAIRQRHLAQAAEGTTKAT